MLTIEKIDEAWANFDKFKETAEQHDFPTILMLDLRLKPYYDDLHKNWNEHHAEMFMRAMQKIGKHLGFKCPEF